MVIRVNYDIFHSPELIKAIKGDDFPNPNHDSRARENSEVVMKFTQMITIIDHYPLVN